MKWEAGRNDGRGRIPAFAGMTWVGAGMTWEGSGMTWVDVVLWGGGKRYDVGGRGTMGRRQAV